MDKTQEKVNSVNDRKARIVDPCTAIKLMEVDQTCGGLFQTRIPLPGFLQEVEWVPGVVRIVFNPAVDSEYIAAAFSVSEDTKAVDEASIKLKNLLKEYGLVSYELTFSCILPGLPAEETPPPGRERYYTLYFPSEKNVVRISEDINNLSRIIERAAPVPKLVPPRANPVNESLVRGGMCGVKQQWYVQRCRVDRAWNPLSPGKGVSGKGVVVADIDWGFRTSHQELNGRIKVTYNSIDGTSDVNQGCQRYHGTAVLGILGAKASGVGMVGFAYEADLWAIQAANDTVNDPRFWFCAIEYVRRTDSQGRRKVICLEASTTGNYNPEMDIAINKAIRDAIAADVVVCVAAGNGTHDVGLDNRGQSFLETGSILVGATVFDPDDTVNRRADFSNWGERVVVSAPGHISNDVSCSSGGDNAYMNNFGGTSGATPKVAGTAALMLEANPRLSHSEVRDILRATGTHITNAEVNPIGTFLNAEAAVCEARRRAGESC